MQISHALHRCRHDPQTQLQPDHKVVCVVSLCLYLTTGSSERSHSTWLVLWISSILLNICGLIAAVEMTDLIKLISEFNHIDSEFNQSSNYIRSHFVGLWR